MKVIIAKVVLNNFKGQKFLEIMFGYETFILGGNGLGKTTILDAIWWNLFGKDSKGRKNFEYKTLDKDGNQIHGLVHSVKVTLIVDGEALELERAVSEKWTKKRGETEKIFTGNVTSYAINNLPVSSEVYKNKINEIIDEEIFKQVTNVYYFTSLPCTEQRAVLSKLVGEVSPMEVIKNNPNLILLSEALNRMDVSQYMKYLSVERNKCNKEIMLIPPRIDECNNQIKEHDFKELEKRKRDLILGIKRVKANEKKREEFLKRKNALTEQLYDEKEKLRLKELEILENSKLNNENLALSKMKQEIRENDLEIQFIEKKINKINNGIKDLKESLKEYEKTKEILRNKWIEENGKSFKLPEEEERCPTCHREYDVETIDKLTREGEKLFEGKKDKVLDHINMEGKKALEMIREIKGKIGEEGKELIELEKQIRSFNEKNITLIHEKEEREKRINALEG
ncbi:MAG: hypothetical protein ACRC2K_12515, partial [Clostridium sp.]